MTANWYWRSISIIIDSLAGIQLFSGQEWNWTGKGAALIAEIILSAVIAGFTLNFPAFFRTLIDGIFLGLLAQKTKSISPSVVVHGLLNLIGNH